MDEAILDEIIDIIEFYADAVNWKSGAVDCDRGQRAQSFLDKYHLSESQAERILKAMGVGNG